MCIRDSPSDDRNANVSWLICGVGAFANSKVYISDSIFSNNAADNVGALGLSQSDVNISTSKFIHNSAMGYSDGAIYIGSGTVVIQSTVFRYNAAREIAGALRVVEGANFVIRDVEFTNNVATSGAACVIKDLSLIHI